MRALGSGAVWLFAAFVVSAVVADALIENAALTRSWWGLVALAVLLLIVLAGINEAGGMTLGARFRSWRELRRYR